MIDINELRRLAQAATPGPWFSDARGNIWRRPLSDLYENGGSVAGDKPIAFVFVGWRGEGVTGYPVENNARLIAASNPSAVTELLDRLEAAESDALEQARLNGMGASREAALMAKLEAAEKDIALKERIIDSLGSELNAVANERDAMRAMLRAALDVLEDVKGNINPERGYADELEADVERAIAIALPGAKGE